MGKKKKDKLPRKLAGIKIPKSLRKSGTSLAGLLESPVAREILAGVLTAAAGALVGTKTARQGVAEAGSTVAEAGTDGALEAAGTTKEFALAATDVVAGVARQVLPSSVAGGSQKAGNEDAKERSDSFTPLAEGAAKGKKVRGRDKQQAH